MKTPYYGHKQVNHSFGVGSTIRWYEGLVGRRYEKANLPDPEDFNPNATYTSWQLDRFADAILWQDKKPHLHYPAILMYEHLQSRRKKEIYVASGIPDPTLTHDQSPDGQTIFWRSHPKGR